MEDVSQGTREVSETTEGVSDEGAVEAEETPTSQPVYGSFHITLTLAVCFVTLNTQLYGLSLAADKVKGRLHLILISLISTSPFSGSVGSIESINLRGTNRMIHYEQGAVEV